MNFISQRTNAKEKNYKKHTAHAQLKGTSVSYLFS